MSSLKPGDVVYGELKDKKGIPNFLLSRIKIGKPENKDSDKDGVPDTKDQCPNTPKGEQVDKNGCSTSQKDTDKDGVSDDKDQCPNTPEGEEVDETGCPISGIEDLENMNISLYPNPCVDVIHLSDIDNINSISIIDITGRVVEKLPAQKDIAVQHLSTGTYIMLIEDKQSNLRRSSFIKQ